MSWSLDAATQGTYGSSNPNTVNHTCASSAKLLVVVLFINSTTARTGGIPTYNGDPLTDSGAGFVYYSGGECGVEVWYRINPDTGDSYTVSVPNTGTINIDISVMSFIPSAGGCVLDTYNSGSGESEDPSITVNSVGDNALMIGALGSGDRDIPAAGTNYSLQHTYDAGNQTWGSEYDLDTGSTGNITVDFNTARSDDWGLIGISFVEMAGPINEDVSASFNRVADMSDGGKAAAEGDEVFIRSAAVSDSGEAAAEGDETFTRMLAITISGMVPEYVEDVVLRISSGVNYDVSASFDRISAMSDGGEAAAEGDEVFIRSAAVSDSGEAETEGDETFTRMLAAAQEAQSESFADESFEQSLAAAQSGEAASIADSTFGRIAVVSQSGLGAGLGSAAFARILGESVSGGAAGLGSASFSRSAAVSQTGLQLFLADASFQKFLGGSQAASAQALAAEMLTRALAVDQSSSAAALGALAEAIYKLVTASGDTLGHISVSVAFDRSLDVSQTAVSAAKAIYMALRALGAAVTGMAAGNGAVVLVRSADLEAGSVAGKFAAVAESYGLDISQVGSVMALADLMSEQTLGVDQIALAAGLAEAGYLYDLEVVVDGESSAEGVGIIDLLMRPRSFDHIMQGRSFALEMRSRSFENIMQERST